MFDSDDDDTSSANTQTNSSTTSNSNSSSGSGNSENSSGNDNGGSSSSGTTTPDTTQETTADDTEDLSNAGSSSVTLPESSGKNPFLNKTFKSNYESLAFGSSYVTYTQFVSNRSVFWNEICSSPMYSLGDSAIFSYSYDDNKGLLYLKLLKWGDYTSAADFDAEHNPASQRANIQLESDAVKAVFNTLIIYEAGTDGTTLSLTPYCNNDIVLPSPARFFYRASSPQPNTLCDIYCSYGIRLLENEINAEGFTSTGIEYYVYPTFNGDTFSGTLYKYNRRSLYDDVTKVGSVSGTWSYAWDNNGIRLKFTSIDCDLLSTDEKYVLKPFSNNVEYTLEE